MELGSPSVERATLESLIAAAAPDALPAAQALQLLRAVPETDAESVGRLAYHALTGVDPGPVGGPDPASPRDVATGFPPFAAEVLMRAICGPDDRRPTPHALLIVLGTVPASSWPTANEPFWVLEEEDDEEDSEEVSEPEPEFDPFHDEWNPGHTPVFESEEPDVEAEDAESAPDADVEVDIETEPEVAAEADVEVDIETEPEVAAEADVEAEAEVEADAEVELDEETAEEPDADATTTKSTRGEFRDAVSPAFDVPRFEPLEGAGELPMPNGEQARHHSSNSRKPADDERQRTIRTIAIVLLVVFVLAAIYLISQRGEDEPSSLPQGASLVTSQPLASRA